MNDLPRNLRAWLLVVLVVAVVTRATIWAIYPLAQSNDTPTYLHLASSLKNNNGFERYNGTRTPGYPIFILLAGSLENVYIFQLCLGLLSTLMVFFIAWRVSRRAWFAGLVGLAHTLNLGQLFFEATLLSESVATFFLFFVLVGLVLLLKNPSELAQPGKQTSNRVARPWNKSMPILLLISAMVSLAAAALALTRPLFAFIPFLGAFFLFFFWRAFPIKTRLGIALLVSIPALLSLLVWVNYIYARFNILGLDSIGGYHLVNHTSSFFELAPDEYAPIRSTFLQFRTEHITRTGSPVNTIWDAIPTLMTQTKLNYYALGRVMGTISGRLISEHPWLYIQNLALGWWWFWKVGVFWLPETISNPFFRKLAIGLMQVERAGLFGINMSFLAGSLALLWPRFRGWFKPDLFTWLAISAIWLTSILQTLAEHGDNPRFLAPLQTLVFLVAANWLVNGWNVIICARKNQNK